MFCDIIYKILITEVVIHIVPSQENPTQHDERRKLTNPYGSTISDQNKVANEDGGAIQTVTIDVDSNGILGKITITSV